MPVVETLSLLALCRLGCLEPPAGIADATHSVRDIAVSLNGHAHHVTAALQQAIERTWIALEVALAGPSLGERMQVPSPDAEDALGRQLRAFLDAVPLQAFGEDPGIRRECRQELHRARQCGLLTRGVLDLKDLSLFSSELADRQETEGQALTRLADELRDAGYPRLGSLPLLRASQHHPFLPAALLFFFRHAVRYSTDWFDDFAPAQPVAADLSQALWEDGFQALAHALDAQGPWLEALLSDLAGGADTSGAGAGPDATRGAAHFQQGLSSFNQGAYPQAIAEFTAALTLDPANAQAYAYRGDAHRLCCAYDQALADLGQAIRLDPASARNYLNRGLILQQRGAAGPAIADFSEALRLDPHDTAALNGRGTARAERGEYDLAIADFTEAIRLAPTQFWAYHNRGKAFNLKGDYQQAVAEFSEVLGLNPNHAPAYTHRGDAFRLLGEYERAAADYTAALWLQPHHVPLHINRGHAYRLQAQAAAAVADYTAALQLEPGNAIALCYRGVLRGLQQEYDEALADLDAAIEADPESAVAYHQRGKIYAALGDQEQAAADYTQVLWIYPEFTLAYVDRALVHQRRGRFAEVLVDCDQALRLDAGLLPAYFLRGTAQARLGVADEAVADFTRALALDAAFAPAYGERGLAYAAQEQYDLALDDFSAALRLEPDNALLHAGRGMVYQLKGEHFHAAHDFSRAVQLDPEQVQKCWSRGMAATLAEGYARALHEYTEGVRPRPEEADAPAELEPDQQAEDVEVAPQPGRQEHTDSAPTPEHASVRVKDKEPGLEPTSEALDQAPAEPVRQPTPTRRAQKKVSPRARAQDRPPQITAASPPQATAEPPAAQTAVETPAKAQGHGAPEPQEKPIPEAVEESEKPEETAVPPQEGSPSLVASHCRACGHDYLSGPDPTDGQTRCPKCRTTAPSASQGARLSDADRPGAVSPDREVAQGDAHGPCHGAPTKTPGGTKTSPGTIRLTCKGCGASSSVRIDRLDKQFICRRCQRVYRVQSNGRLIELRAKRSRRDLLAALGRKGLRLLPVPLVILALSLGGWYGWRALRADDLPPLPLELPVRAEMLTKAWFSGDTNLMRRLTLPSQGQKLRRWLNDHRSPLAPEDLNSTRAEQQTRVEVQILKEKGDGAQLQVRVSNPLSSPVEVQQYWVKEGDTWFFLPPSENQAKGQNALQDFPTSGKAKEKLPAPVRGGQVTPGPNRPGPPWLSRRRGT